MSSIDKHKIIWPLEPHTEAKHDILRAYLGAWFPVMQKWNRRLVFLDGFAGPGVYRDGEPGSPIVTLEVLLGHDHFDRWRSIEFTFLFCEPEPKRFASLEERIGELDGQVKIPKNVNVHIIDEYFEEVGRQLLDSLGSASLAPTLAFLDPFGVKGVPMELVSQLMSFQRGEVLLNFAVKNMARFATTKEMRDHLTAMFGDNRWTKVVDLPVADRHEPLRDLYIEALKEHCGFEYVWPFEMVSQGTTSYYLIYATNHIKGLELMKDAMWKVAPSGAFRFSSSLDDNQISLMDPAATAHLLQEDVADHFAGMTVSITDVERYVLTDTPYRKAHTRQQALQPLEKATPPRIVVDRPGVRGFPDGTTIRFL